MASKKDLAAAAGKAVEKKAGNTSNILTAGKKKETETFSVRIDADIIKRWRIYASIDGYGDKGKLTEQALTEYMNRHKLNPEQQAKFDTLYGV